LLLLLLLLQVVVVVVVVVMVVSTPFSGVSDADWLMKCSVQCNGTEIRSSPGTKSCKSCKQVEFMS
jgi:hypothetical protein